MRLIMVAAPEGRGVAALTEPPIKYRDFNTLFVSVLISVVVGAGLANVDDSGQRRPIGQAASAQIALIPVWLGIAAVFGFPATTSQNQIIERVASFFLNSLTMIGVTFIVYTLSNAASRSLKNPQTGPDHSANPLKNERRIA